MNRVQTSKCTVVVPAYNEAERIRPVIEELTQNFSSILIVDDHSDDDLRTTLKDFSQIIILRHPVNCGQGAAIQTGMEFVRSNLKSEFIVTFDADGQHSALDAMKALSLADSNGLDAVLGRRFLEEKSQVPITKRLVLKVAIRLNKNARRLKLTDLHNGLRVFRLNKFYDLELSPGMSHADDIVQFISKRGLSISESAMEITYDIEGKKSQSLFNGVNIMIERILIR